MRKSGIPMLSLRQPYATLIAVGAKRIETRSWRTTYRGPLLIHAGKRDSIMGLDARVAASKALAAVGMSPRLLDVPHGVVVGVTSITRLVRTAGVSCGIAYLVNGEQVPMPDDLFGDYSVGRWAWFLGPTRRIEPPVPCRGALSIHGVPDEIATECLRRANYQREDQRC